MKEIDKVIEILEWEIDHADKFNMFSVVCALQDVLKQVSDIKRLDDTEDKA